MTIVATIEDLQRLASRRVPRMFYDLVDADSYSEGTYRANEADLSRIKLRQRVAVDVGARNLKTCLLGEEVTMPVALAPAGLTGMQRADGEILAARAAERFGVPFTLSTISVLPSIVDAVAARTEVWMDGGVRSGQDVFKACALGARGVMIGRGYLYGLGAEGEAGVDKCLDIIRRELDATLALSGTADIRKAGRDNLVAGTW
ncbi:alpha-hydroxy-acid oxidizing protein [Metapseudomonas resinovorans]|uniref:alpha-hydroxy-acid oxidizing protein n=1 Tax=Metapseudomonas resinovorans TaxID=53412 RepID=UPI0003A73891|nr:alpha-hydroxy-acid oxidizing protein [Pseudomonas resinovorans]